MTTKSLRGPGLGRGDLARDQVPLLDRSAAHLDPALLLKVLGHERVVKGTERPRVQTVVNGHVGTLSFPGALRRDTGSVLRVPGLFLHHAPRLDPARGSRQCPSDGLEAGLQLDCSVAFRGPDRDKVVGLRGAIHGRALDVLADGLTDAVSGPSARWLDAGNPLRVRRAGSDRGRLI